MRKFGKNIQEAIFTKLFLCNIGHNPCVHCKLFNVLAMLESNPPRRLSQNDIIPVIRGEFHVPIFKWFSLHPHVRRHFNYNNYISAFGMLPFTPTDAREVLITVLQVMPELAMVFEVTLTKQCKFYHQHDQQHGYV